MTKEKDILAFEYYGSEMGKNYFIEDFQTDNQVEMLFDLAQILQVNITSLGWQQLFENFGIQRLFTIDKKSGWMDTDNENEWIESIIYNALICGYNPIDSTIGDWDEELNVFKTENSQKEIDWNQIHKMKIENSI